MVATANVDVLTACGNSVECIFDASQTGNLDIGLETMAINVANVVNRQEASELWCTYVHTYCGPTYVFCT